MTDKQKNILQMTKDICRHQNVCNDVCKPISACDALRYAERAVEAGYCKQEWISVDERLPDVLQEVLVYRGNHIGNLMNAYTYVGGDMWQDEYGFGCRREDEGITHWMPLPEAPKMKGGAE